MEGLSYPEATHEYAHFVFFESATYAPKIRTRYRVTKDILDKQHIAHTSITIEGSTPLTQVLTTMLFGMYLAFCLSRIHEQDPSDIPWVTYFKEQLR
jgi:hypothetical protein